MPQLFFLSPASRVREQKRIYVYIVSQGKKRENRWKKTFWLGKKLGGNFSMGAKRSWTQRGGESGQAGGNGNEKMKNPKRKSK